MKNTLFAILLISLLSPITLLAQDANWINTKNIEAWSAMKFSYKLNKKWKIGLEEQLRLQTSPVDIDSYFTELNTSYNINKNVYGGIGIRYIRKNDNKGKVQGYENYTRLHIDLGATHDIERFNIDYRLRLQTKKELNKLGSEENHPNNYVRLKVGLGYNIKKWKFDPKLSAELFRHYEKGEEVEFNKLRLTLGTRYKINSSGKLGFFYRIERELNIKKPVTANIVGIKYSYTLKRKKKSKK